MSELKTPPQVREPIYPGSQGPEWAHITTFLYFLHCLACVYVSGIVSYASAVSLSRCRPSECVVVARSSLSPFLTHFFHAVMHFARVSPAQVRASCDGQHHGARVSRGRGMAALWGAGGCLLGGEVAFWLIITPPEGRRTVCLPPQGC